MASFEPFEVQFQLGSTELPARRVTLDAEINPGQRSRPPLRGVGGYVYGRQEVLDERGERIEMVFVAPLDIHDEDMLGP